LIGIVDFVGSAVVLLMDLAELKQKVEAIETSLVNNSFVCFHTFKRDDHKLHVCLTDRLRKKCRKGKVWKSKKFLTALKNAEYGFDKTNLRSKGGRDGIFLIDRNYKPPNMIMRKIFNQFIDKEIKYMNNMAENLKTDIKELLAVRLVSHHMRLLGILKLGQIESWLVLADYDDTK